MTIFRRAATVVTPPASVRAIGQTVSRTAAPSAGLVEMDDVSKTYQAGTVKVRALDGVTLRVERGEMVAIMGPSGCGKTTLLNCISGLDVVDAGAVRIAGTDLNTMTDNARTSFRAQQMGFIFQTYNLLPVLSSVENVELPLVVSGTSPREARKRALVALEGVGLAHVAGNRPSQLSGGQRQRVTIARALVNQPEIVWADEPTGALDSRTADDIMSLMETLNRERGITFVLVTHDPGIGSRCHRIVHMRDGQITSEERLR